MINKPVYKSEIRESIVRNLGITLPRSIDTAMITLINNDLSTLKQQIIDIQKITRDLERKVEQLEQL